MSRNEKIALSAAYCIVFLGLSMFLVTIATIDPIMWLFTILLIPMGIWASVDIDSIWSGPEKPKEKLG